MQTDEPNEQSGITGQSGTDQSGSTASATPIILSNEQFQMLLLSLRAPTAPPTTSHTASNSSASTPSIPATIIYTP